MKSALPSPLLRATFPLWAVLCIAGQGIGLGDAAAQSHGKPDRAGGKSGAAAKRPLEWDGAYWVSPTGTVWVSVVSPEGVATGNLDAASCPRDTGGEYVEGSMAPVGGSRRESNLTVPAGTSFPLFRARLNGWSRIRSADLGCEERATELADRIRSGTGELIEYGWTNRRGEGAFLFLRPADRFSGLAAGFLAAWASTSDLSGRDDLLPRLAAGEVHASLMLGEARWVHNRVRMEVQVGDALLARYPKGLTLRLERVQRDRTRDLSRIEGPVFCKDTECVETSPELIIFPNDSRRVWLLEARLAAGGGDPRPGMRLLEMAVQAAPIDMSWRQPRDLVFAFGHISAGKTGTLTAHAAVAARPSGTSLNPLTIGEARAEAQNMPPPPASVTPLSALPPTEEHGTTTGGGPDRGPWKTGLALILGILAAALATLAARLSEVRVPTTPPPAERAAETPRPGKAPNTTDDEDRESERLGLQLMIRRAAAQERLLANIARVFGVRIPPEMPDAEPEARAKAVGEILAQGLAQRLKADIDRALETERIAHDLDRETLDREVDAARAERDEAQRELAHVQHKVRHLEGGVGPLLKAVEELARNATLEIGTTPSPEEVVRAALTEIQRHEPTLDTRIRLCGELLDEAMRPLESLLDPERRDLDLGGHAREVAALESAVREFRDTFGFPGERRALARMLGLAPEAPLEDFDFGLLRDKFFDRFWEKGITQALRIRARMDLVPPLGAPTAVAPAARALFEAALAHLVVVAGLFDRVPWAPALGRAPEAWMIVRDTYPVGFFTEAPELVRDWVRRSDIADGVVVDFYRAGWVSLVGEERHGPRIVTLAQARQAFQHDPARFQGRAYLPPRAADVATLRASLAGGTQTVVTIVPQGGDAQRSA